LQQSDVVPHGWPTIEHTQPCIPQLSLQHSLLLAHEAPAGWQPQ